MSHADTIKTSGSAGLGAYWSGIADRYRRYRVYSATVNELRGLSPRELDDLGIKSTSINDVAYRAAYGA